MPVTCQLEPDFYAAFSESSALWSRFVLRIAPGRGLETEASQTRSHLLLYRMARNGVCFYSGYHAAVWHRHARRTIGDKGRRCSQIEATPRQARFLDRLTSDVNRIGATTFVADIWTSYLTQDEPSCVRCVFSFKLLRSCRMTRKMERRQLRPDHDRGEKQNSTCARRSDTPERHRFDSSSWQYLIQWRSQSEYRWTSVERERDCDVGMERLQSKSLMRACPWLAILDSDRYKFISTVDLCRQVLTTAIRIRWQDMSQSHRQRGDRNSVSGSSKKRQLRATRRLE